MAFPGAHKYLAMSGVLRGSERFSIGLRMTTGTFSGSQEREQETCDDLATIVGDWWSGNGTVGSVAQLDTVKYNAIGADGKYLQDWTAAAYFTSPISGGGGTSPYPNQITTVATLETGATRGLASRGRVFLPAPSPALEADGRMAEASATTIAGRVKELLDNLNAYGDAGQVIVASNVRSGAIRPVTGVSVGRVLDTMRSRRTSLDEGRMSVALAAGT